MSGTEMKASVLLTLEDRLTDGIERLLKVLDRLSDAVEKMGTRMGALNLKKPFDEGAQALDRVAASAEKAATKLGAMERAVAGARAHMTRLVGAAREMGALGAVGASVGLMMPLRAYGEYENTLRHIAITENLSGAQVAPAIGRLSAMFGADAVRSGQSSRSIALAYADLVQSGIPAAIIDKVIAQHSEAATAYNIAPEELGHAVGALLQNFRVPEGEIGSALAAMALAGKEGRFKVADFSRELPGISGVMAQLGMKGREGADTAFAALELVTRNASDPAQASAAFYDALSHITAPFATRFFRKAGIDLPALLRGAEAKGVDPLDAVLDKLAGLVQGKTPVASAEIIGGLIHNQQARQAILALLQHHDEFMKLREKLGHVDRAMLDRDFITAFQAPEVQLRIFDELLARLERRIGQGFAPVLRSMNFGLLWLSDTLASLDNRFPGLVDAVLIGTGGFLAFAAVLGAIGFVLPAIGTGFSALAAVVSLVAEPFVLLGLAVGFVVWDIWAHWERFRGFFVAMGDGVKAAALGLAEFFAGVFSLDMTRAERGIEGAWSGLKAFFKGLFDAIKTLAQDFNDWLAAWALGPIETLSKILKGLGISGVNMMGAGAATAPAYLGGGPALAPPSGEIVIRAAPGTHVESAKGTGVKLRVERSPAQAAAGDPNTGRMVGRE